MKRTLKRSRMLGVLAVLLTMSLVAAFGAPVAVADEKGNERKGRQDCKPRDDKSKNERSDRANNDNCDENGDDAQSKGAPKNEGRRAGGSDESRPKGNSEGNGNTGSKGRSEGNSSSGSNRESQARSAGKDNGSGSSKSKSNRSSEGSSEARGDNRARGNEGTVQGNANGNTHPPGNNGTVKIDGVPFGDHPNNEPHPGCVFEVDFYNYEEGDLSATVTFTSHPPTQPAGEVVLSESDIFIGEDAGMGGTDLDATRTYTLDLSGYTAHEQQGHHIKLTVNAEGSQGADTKHKVFWVDCVEDAVPDDEDEVDDDVIEDDVDQDQDSVETEGDDDTVLGTRIQRGGSVVRSEAEVAGQQEEDAEVRSAVLPFTGAALAAFALLGIGLIGTGATFLRRRRTG